MFNPEYGERLGENEELELTYKRMGDFMKQKCPGYRGYIFTGNMELAKKIGLKASRRIEFWNGAMSGWNTIFVEVPLITFNPVKTVNDLLRDEHQ
jgi:23S rRNA G2445 N2-methylase RlmL